MDLRAALIAALAAFLTMHGTVVAAGTPAAPAAGEAKRVVVTLFWGQGCPHCEQEKLFLEDLKRTYPSLTVREYEVWKDRGNAALYKRLLEAAKIRQSGVPGTVVGTTFFLGFSEQTRRGIAEAVARCVREGCADGGAPAAGNLPREESGGKALHLPLIGTIDPAKMSLPVFTLVIAGLDSFNPCAFYVLLFLLSILVHARSRRRMLLIGGIFVLSSGVVYFLFMAAWLSVFMVIGSLTAITIAGGVTALIIGGINVKDFFLFKQGVSLTIPDAAKPKLFERMRGLVRATTLPSMVLGTTVLALAANAYELLCTAGFPMIYTRVLTLQGLTTTQYYRYLALYNVIYIIPLGLIVAVITRTLGARKLTEWQGRKLKLLSGLMMASLGAVLIVDPALLNNVLASVLLLAAVVLVSWALIRITQRVRPESTA